MTTIRTPPGPQRAFPGQHLLALRRDPLAFLHHLTRTYGDIVHLRVGAQPLYLLNHPDLMKEVLVTHNSNFIKGRALERARRLLGNGLLTSAGADHLRQRRLIQPLFHRQRIAAYGATMVQCALQTRERWQPGATLDIADAMMHLTLAIVGQTLFATDVTADSDQVGAALTALMHSFGLLMLPFGELLEHLPLPAMRRFRRARADLDAIIYRMIGERRRSGTDHGDLLALLLQAQDAEGAGALTDTQVRDEALTLFLAGHETTANALTWTWYLLAQHPHIAARLHAELDAVLGGRPPSFDDLPHLVYTRMVFAEVLRLYPPAWAIGRRALREQMLGGYPIPSGAIVLMSQYVTHRDPRFYPDPTRFEPLRWTPEAQAARPKYAYFPFGAGARLCIGEQFAWMEGILLLATLAQRWRPRLVPGQRIVPQPRVTLRPKYGIHMILEP